MGMVVKNNMSAVRTLNTLNSNTSALQKSLQKVSSGMKINSAQDDASGYAISERMRVRIRSLDQANQNSQNDSSLMKTAEGAVGNTVEILRALKEKAINAANDSNTDEDRQTIQKEINQFIDQIDDNALVQFNGKYLVDGSKNNAVQDTKSILLNQSLRTGTSSSSVLTELSNRAGDSLGIQTTDQYQVSWVQNGTIHFTSGIVKEKAISDILNVTAKVTDADGNVSTVQFGQVKATGENGLISAPAEEKVNQFSDEPMTLAIDDTTGYVETSSVADLIAAVDDYLANNSDGKGVGDTFDITALKATVKDTNGDDVKVNAFGKSPTENFATGDVTIVKDASGNYTITSTLVGDGDPIYTLNSEYVKPVNTTDKYLGTEYTITVDETLDTTTAGGKTVGGFSNEFSKELATLSELAITPPAESGSVTTPDPITKTLKLSDIQATDANGAPVFEEDGTTAVPKYVVLDETGKDITNTITVTRTQTFVENPANTVAVTSDKIEFTTTSGADLTKATISEYNPKYTPAGDDNGLTDAADKFGKAVYTPDKTDGVAFGATTAGVNYQISGLTVSILDQDGNVKKAANAALDQFKQYQRAENKTGDMSLNFHIGSEANVAFKVGLGDMRAQALGLKGSDGTRIDVYTKEHANAAINVIENALTKALDQQTTIGAIEARLEYTSTNLTTSSENVQAAESTIRDADMAKEMTNYTKSNVLLQAAQAMLAQANQNSSAVLSLLQ